MLGRSSRADEDVVFQHDVSPLSQFPAQQHICVGITLCLHFSASVARDENNFALERKFVGFTLSRSAMLELMADTVGVPHERRSAFLGRFQHLQRLKLIEGINPGRGKAAEYRAHQMVIILIAFQMLQLGLTPERAVDVIRANEDHIRQAINIATATKEGDIAPSMIWFDPAFLSTVDGFDPATATLGYAGAEQGFEALLTFFIVGQVDRAAFIGLSGSLWQLVRAIDGADLDAREKKVGEKGREFLASLREWCENPEQELPDGLNP